MTLARLLLIALLAALLPVRGVLGAAMLCTPGHHAPAQSQHGHLPAGHHGAEAVHAMADHHADHAGPGDHASPAAGHAGHHPGAAAGTDTCHLCAACCAMPPLAGAAPQLALLLGDGAAAFPALRVPPPDFVSGGQDRPPRRT